MAARRPLILAMTTAAALFLATPTWVRGDDPPAHVHDFDTNPNYPISSEPVRCQSVAVPGELITVGVEQTEDVDTCNNGYGCCFQDGRATNPLKVTAWSDGNKGGTFGRMEGNQFIPCSPTEQAELITHYRCPTTLLQDPIPIRATLDERTLEAQVPNPPPATVITKNDDPVQTDAREVFMWDITTPAAVPPGQPPAGRYALNDAYPAITEEIPLEASLPSLWSVELGPEPELRDEWDQTGEPTVARSFWIRAYCELEGQTGKLPQHNHSFGPKEITATEFSGVSRAEREIWLFYTKDAANHPMTGTLRDYDRNGGAPTKNWYWYWSQTSANYGDHLFNSAFTRSHTAWDGTHWQAYICTGTALGPAGTPPDFAWNKAEGIDLFANVCRHEATHVGHLTGWWPAGPPAPDANPHPDADGDHIPNNLEAGLTEFHAAGYTAGARATYDDHFNYGANWDDCEDYCMHVQARDRPWVNGAANAEDWSAGTKSKQWPQQP
ncbi:MAG: hypothetical protein HY321_01595 [Armatimonadetes bacterium]|nr:hypothetical protein [Armatimonadota bacterium]